jgi:hypothetical protein
MEGPRSDETLLVGVAERDIGAFRVFDRGFQQSNDPDDVEATDSR